MGHSVRNVTDELLASAQYAFGSRLAGHLLMNGNQAKEPDEHETPCPRCGTEAEWLFLNTEKSRIAVICPDCGRYEMTREQFDETAAERAEVSDVDS